jgi:hypothetical protein
MRRPGACLAAITATVLALNGCATVRVGSHTEHGLSWAQYRTFDWGRPDPLPAGDPRLDKDPYFQDQMQGAIERQMAVRGFARAAGSGTADLLVHYHATTAERIDVDEIDRSSGYCVTPDCRPRVTRYEAGTLVVDIVDARTNRLIWRGWAQEKLDRVLGHEDRVRRAVDDSVVRMFSTLPVPK